MRDTTRRGPPPNDDKEGDPPAGGGEGDDAPPPGGDKRPNDDDGGGDEGRGDDGRRDDDFHDDDDRDDDDCDYHDHHYYFDFNFWYVCGWWGWWTWGYLWCDDLYYPWVWYYRTHYGRVVYVYYPYWYDDYTRVYAAPETEVYPPLPSSSYADPEWTIEQHLQHGRELFLAGDYMGAAEAFRQAILLDVKDPMPKFAYAQALFALGNYPFAALAIRLGLTLLPDWPLLGGDVRDFYAKEEDFTEHMQALSYYLQERPDEPHGLLVWGYMSYFSGQIDAANMAFTKILQRYPDDPAARTFSEVIGALLYKQQQEKQRAAPVEGEGVEK
ncbi:MAG: hypothetical protein AB1486_15445 [Planctomycetota bacterium]